MRTASCRRGASTRRGAPSPASGTRRSRASVFVAPATFQVPHLVQPAFLLLGFASHPFALLDQLADLLPALVTDLGVELRTACGPDRLAALLADLLVELVPALRLDGLAALASDLLVERAAALLGDLHSALAPRLGYRHSALLVLRHLTASGGWKEPPSRPLRLLQFSGSASQDALLDLLCNRSATRTYLCARWVSCTSH